MSVLLRLSTVFLLALSVFLGVVSAHPRFNAVERVNLKKREGYVTNAARMAAGLGPLMPRNLFDPSRVKVARAPQPSGSAPLTGRIKVTDAAGGIRGFMTKNYDPSGRLDVTAFPNMDDHLTVSFPPPASSASRFNILITSQGNPGPSSVYLGFALGADTLNTFPQVPYFTTLTATNPTTVGGIAEMVGNGMSSKNVNFFSESPIWSYDASTGRLSDTWFNPSSPGSSTGTAVAVHKYLWFDGSIVQSTSDVTPMGFVEVFFTLV